MAQTNPLRTGLPGVNFIGTFTWAALSATTGNPGDMAMVSDLGYAQFVWNGTRWRPPSGVLLLVTDWVEVSLTGTTTPTQLKTVTVPANILGPNGAMQIRVFSNQTSSANNKTVDLRVNGAAQMIQVSTTNAQTASHYFYGNRGLTNNQRFRGITNDVGGSFNQVNVTGPVTTFDSTSPLTLAVFGTLANAADSIFITHFFVELYIP